MKRLIELINKIQFDDTHNKNIFWAPRTITCQKNNQYPGKHPGYTLYAYGGAVMSLYQIADDEYYGAPFAVSYCKYFSKDKKDEKKGKTIRADFISKIKHGIDFLETWNYWDDVLYAMDNRNFGERRRENIIVCKNAEYGHKYEVFDMESNTKINETDNKFDAKADMMWLSFVEGKPVISFVEYKCTNGAMGNQEYALSGHFRKMVNYYDRPDVKANVLTLLKRKRMLNDDEPEVTFEDFDTEIVFLFSHMNPTRHSKYDNGVSEGNIKSRLLKMYTDNKEKVEENKGKIRIAFIDDEDSCLEEMVSTMGSEIDFSSEHTIWDSIYVKPFSSENT